MDSNLGILVLPCQFPHILIMSSGEKTENLLDLHKQFRSVISLTALTSIINKDGGRSTIFRSINPFKSFDQKLPTRSLVLNAIAAVLVRNNEVIATVCHGPKPEIPGYRVVAMENTPSLQDDDPPLPFKDSDFMHMSGVTAVANPRHDDDRTVRDAIPNILPYSKVISGDPHLTGKSSMKDYINIP
jgi:hypothetical protein